MNNAIKKLLAVAFVICLLFTLAACDDKDKDSKPSQSPSASVQNTPDTSATTQVTQETTTAPEGTATAGTTSQPQSVNGKYYANGNKELFPRAPQSVLELKIDGTKATITLTQAQKQPAFTMKQNIIITSSVKVNGNEVSMDTTYGKDGVKHYFSMTVEDIKDQAAYDAALVDLKSNFKNSGISDKITEDIIAGKNVDLKDLGALGDNLCQVFPYTNFVATLLDKDSFCFTKLHAVLDDEEGDITVKYYSTGEIEEILAVSDLSKAVRTFWKNGNLKNAKYYGKNGNSWSLEYEESYDEDGNPLYDDPDPIITIRPAPTAPTPNLTLEPGGGDDDDQDYNDPYPEDAEREYYSDGALKKVTYTSEDDPDVTNVVEFYQTGMFKRFSSYYKDKLVFDNQLNEQGNEVRRLSYGKDADGEFVFIVAYEIEYLEDGETLAKRTNFDESGNVRGSREYEYYDNGEQKSETVKDGNGEMIGKIVLDQEGNVTYAYDLTYDYDDNVDGYKITQYSENGDYVETYYDLDDNVVSVAETKLYENGNTKSKTVRDGDRVIQETLYDQDGKVTYRYEAFFDEDGIAGFMATEYLEDGGYVETYYDVDGTIQMSQQYNSDDQCVKYTWYDVDGNIESYEEDEFYPNGEIAKETVYVATEDGFAKYSEIQYDQDGKEIKETWYYDDGSSGSVVYEYHSNSQISKMTEYISSAPNADYIKYRQNEYDRDGNEINETYFDENGDPCEYTTYKYHSNGEVSEETSYMDNGSGLEKIYTTEYDQDGNEIKVSWYENDIVYQYIIIEHHANGERSKQTRYCAVEDGFVINEEIEYNNDGQETKTTWYDEEGNVKYYSTSEYHPNGELAKYTAYDANGNIEQELNYDENGNEI